MARTKHAAGHSAKYVASAGTDSIDPDVHNLLWREQVARRGLNGVGESDSGTPNTASGGSHRKDSSSKDSSSTDSSRTDSSRTDSSDGLSRSSALAPADADDARPGLLDERRARRLNPWWKRWENVAVGVLLAILIVVVDSVGLYDAPMRFDDEGTYVSQALAVLHGHLAPYTYWYDHPPFGWMLLALWYAGPGHLFPGPNPIATGRQAMMLVLAVSVLCLYLTLRRLDARRWCAVAGCLAFGLSPLAIDMHRTVLLDNIAIMFMLAALMFSVSTSRRLVATGLCGLSMAFAILSKETLLLMLPFVAWLLWRTRRGGTRAMSLTIFGLTLTLPVLYYPLLALLKGELFPGPHHVSLWQGIMFQLVDRQSSGSIFDPHSVAHSVVSDWFRLDWYVLAVGAALTPLLLFTRRRWALLGATLMQTLMLVRPGYLPQPFVLVLLPLAGMNIALGLDQISTWLVRPFGRRLKPGTEGTSAPRINVGMGPRWQRGVAVTLAVLLTAGFGVLAADPLNTMWHRDNQLMTTDADHPYQVAVSWVEHHVPTNRLVVADNVVWTDLVDRDHRPQDRVVWFTKLGVDSAVNEKVPTWRDIDYVVSSDILRNSTQSDVLRDALAHSHVVSTAGSGSTLVEVRQVQH